MPPRANLNDKIAAVIVLLSTAVTIYFNWSAAVGRMTGMRVGDVSELYPTILTPADYAFSIWALIYAGMAAFSIYQMFPANLAKYRDIRTQYVISCLLNCGWIYFWLANQIALAFGIMIALAATLFLINFRLKNAQTAGEIWLAKNPFGLYFGWVTIALFINLAVLLNYLNIEFSSAGTIIFAVGVMILSALISLAVRIKLGNFVFPVAIAWALTGIAVKQVGQTWVMATAAFAVMGCLIIASSFVLEMPTAQEKLGKNS